VLLKDMMWQEKLVDEICVWEEKVDGGV